MKVTDLNEIVLNAKVQLAAQDSYLVVLVGEEQAALMVANIYLTNDQLKALGQDIPQVVSVISSRDRISVIIGQNQSYFKSDYPLCLYEDLADDCNMIVMVMEAAFDRLLSRS